MSESGAVRPRHQGDSRACPQRMLIAVGAVLFGKLPAFAYGWLAGLVGTTAMFLLVRSVARDYMQRTLGARSERLRPLNERVTRNGFGTVFVLRLVLPASTPDPATWAERSASGLAPRCRAPTGSPPRA
jgi:hypothetical protein